MDAILWFVTLGRTGFLLDGRLGPLEAIWCLPEAFLAPLFFDDLAGSDAEAVARAAVDLVREISAMLWFCAVRPGAWMRRDWCEDWTFMV